MTDRPRELRAAGWWISGGLVCGVAADLTVHLPALSGTLLAGTGVSFAAAGWQLWQLRRRRMRGSHEQPRG